MSREAMLERIRTGLRGTPEAQAPAARIVLPSPDAGQRERSFTLALEALAGKVFPARDAAEARTYVEQVLEGREAVASNAPFLRECGITAIPGVRTGFTNAEELRAACASAPVGITSAHYALADTGTLVMIASPEEARLISLLPPVHIAVVPRSRMLSGLDELLSLFPKPADRTSSMVLITGPSRTADIEQILVRGVHGPGEIHAVLV